MKIIYPENYSGKPALEKLPLPFPPCEAGWYWPEEARKYMLVVGNDVYVALDSLAQCFKTDICVAKDFVYKFYHDYKVHSIIEWNDWWLKSDADCSSFVDQAIAVNPKDVEDYKKGKEAAIKHIMGQAMRLSKGKISPNVAMEMLKQRLG